MENQEVDSMIELCSSINTVCVKVSSDLLSKVFGDWYIKIRYLDSISGIQNPDSYNFILLPDIIK